MSEENHLGLEIILGTIARGRAMRQHTEGPSSSDSSLDSLRVALAHYRSAAPTFLRCSLSDYHTQHLPSMYASSSDQTESL